MTHYFRSFAAISASLAVIALPLLALLPNLASPVQAAFPGYNGKIAFVSYRDGQNEIYTMDVDGSNQTRLTSHVSGDTVPVWSPDGTRILFVSGRDGTTDLYVMDVDGTNVVRLTSDAAIDTHPKWSPDGTMIFYSKDGIIYEMNADGSDAQPVSGNPVSGSALDISPDGSAFAFSRSDVLDSVYLMDRDGQNETLLSDNAMGNYEPAFSPDGQKLAFYRGAATLVIISIDGTGEIEYTLEDFGSDTAYLLDVAWSPNGTKLLLSFMSDDWSALDLYAFNPSANTLTRMTEGTSFSGDWQSLSNVAPNTNNDSLAVIYETAGSASVLTNDTDEEALEGSYLSITVQPSHGMASVNTALGKIEYTPNDGYSGSDSLTYRICDSFLLDQKCSTAVLGITVGAPGAPSLTVSKVNDQTVTPGGSYSSATSKPTFSGTASPGAEIKVEIHSDPIILTTTAGNDGTWSVTPTAPIPPGQHTVTISATLNGQTTTLDSFVLGIQAEIPATGADTTNLRLAGFAILAAGGGMSLYYRRFSRRSSVRVPQLFP